MVEFRMPSLGADMESGFLREWHIKPGDAIKRGDIIAEVETQKGIIDIEVFDEGVVGDLLIRLDEKVPVGTLMTYILTPEEAGAGLRPSPPVAAPEAVAAAWQEEESKRKTTVQEARHVRASPLARKLAIEKGIDLATLHGTGPGGAITREDVEGTAASRREPASAASAAENVRMAVAAAMSRSNRDIPHYYLQTRIDISRALSWLSAANRNRTVRDRLLPAVLYIRAVALALREIPELNAWWEGELQPKSGIHIGFVVALRGGGIIVPAIHDADKKNPDEIMRALSDIIPRARALRLKSSELADSTVTITNLGDDAVDSVLGVIYPPQVALVGFGGITEQPWSENGMLAVRPVLTASLSADHRATDGNTGNRFLLAVKKYLTNPDTL